MDNLKKRLKSGETLIGPILIIPSPDVAEIMALVGFDYLWIDLEHGPGDIIQAQALIQAVGGRCPCVIRVPENKEVWIKKALDTGCDGVVVPQVRTAAEAQEAVACCLYPPEGRRGAGAGRAQGYGMTFQDYVAKANETVVIIIQIEHADAVRNIDEILAVPGIDAVLIGPFDLSGSLGLLGQITHPRVQEAIETVRSLCIQRHSLEARVPLGIYAVDAQAARGAIAGGFTLIALNTDAGWLAKGARQALEEARA